MNWTISQTVDLAQGYTPVVWPNALMVSGDVGAHTWRVTVLDNGVTADLSGATITGNFLRDDGATVQVAGSASGNIASVTLTDACYAVEGKLVGTMRAVISGATVTLAAVVYTVKLLTSGDVVDPGVTYQDFTIDASPAGTYADLAALNADPSADVSKIYLTLDDGNWCYHNGAAWVAGGVYQATAIADGSVTPEKTSFFEFGNNLFDVSKVSIGYVVHTTGAFVVDEVWRSSDYIGIDPTKTYSISYVRELAYYDQNKDRVGGFTHSGGPSQLTPPATASFFRFSYTRTYTTPIMVNEGSTQLPYEPYFERIPSEMLDLPLVEEYRVQDGAITPRKTSFLLPGKNLFNPATVTHNHFVNDVTGEISPSTSYVASDYIAVVPGQKYTQSDATFSAFYNNEKVFVSGIGSDNGARTFTVPANAVYVRVSAKTQSQSYLTYQLENGDIATGFEPYALRLEEGIKLADSENAVLLYLPEEICVAVGRTIEIYNQQVAWCGNYDNYHFSWRCQIGKSMKRKYTITGTNAHIGTHSLRLTIYDNQLKAVAIAETTLRIVPNIMNNGKNLLCIGDSLTSPPTWRQEMRTLSGGKLTFVGTRGDAPLKHEGRAGFSAHSYLTETAFTYAGEGVHPFWDSVLGRFNWAKYKQTYGIAPDAVQIFLGTNGMEIDPTTNANNIKQIVDYIRQDDPNIPIFLVHTLYRGSQDGIGNEVPSQGYSYEPGAWKKQEDRKVFNLALRLYELMGGYTNLHFVPVAQCHDSEHNFGAVETPVNPRAAQVESLPSEATHPQPQGYLQMADIMYSVMVAKL